MSKYNGDIAQSLHSSGTGSSITTEGSIWGSSKIYFEIKFCSAIFIGSGSSTAKISKISGSV